MRVPLVVSLPAEALSSADVGDCVWYHTGAAPGQWRRRPRSGPRGPALRRGGPFGRRRKLAKPADAPNRRRRPIDEGAWGRRARQQQQQQQQPWACWLGAWSSSQLGPRVWLWLRLGRLLKQTQLILARVHAARGVFASCVVWAPAVHT